MNIEVLPDPEAVAQTAAEFTAGEARAAVRARGRFIMAVSGGRTPWTMLRALADQPLPWADVHVVQVDERVAPAGHPDRNLTQLRESLLAHCPLRPEQVHAMPVESANLDAASDEYATTLKEIAGAPVVLDLVHLGLGPRRPYGVAGSRRSGARRGGGRRHGDGRLSRSTPNDVDQSILDRARRTVWLVTGREKAEMLGRLHAGDRSIPAGRVRQRAAVVLADDEAAAALGRLPSRR